MDPRLTFESVEALLAEQRRNDESRRLANEVERRAAGSGAVTIRMASSNDGPALHRLAALDSATAPTGPTLVAEEHGEVVAALPVDGGKAVADPFRRTAELVRLLELRAGQLRRGGRPQLRRLGPRRLHPRAAER